MRLKEFLNEGTFDHDNSKWTHKKETRTKQISSNQAKDIILSKCKIALERARNGNFIYRGNDKFSAPFGYLNPKGTDRKSAYTKGNYYTLIINNSKLWKAYPKRNVICSLSNYYASTYNNLKLVLPFDGTKIGVCGTRDIWDAVDLKRYHMHTLSSFNETLVWIFHHYLLKKDPLTWKTFVKDCKKIDDTMDKYEKADIMSEFGNSKTIPVDFLQYLEGLLDPNRHKFSLTDISKIKTKGKDNEIWFNNECILIDIDQREFLNDLEIYGDHSWD